MPTALCPAAGSCEPQAFPKQIPSRLLEPDCHAWHQKERILASLVTLAAGGRRRVGGYRSGLAWAQTALATQKESDDRSLTLLVERLSGRVGVVEQRLRRTRRALRKSQARIKRLEEKSASPANARRLVSPDRRFSIVASNDGLRLLGPDAFVALGANTITLDSGGSETQLQLTPGSAGLRAGTGVFDFAATASLTAPLVSLGGRTGCRPAARINDAVRAGGEAGLGTITAGSQRVLAC